MVCMKKILLKTIATLFCILIAVSSTMSAGELSAISFDGLRLVQEEGLRKQITSKAGESFSAEAVKEDIKILYRTGYFKNVLAEVADNSGSEILVFKLQEKPSVRKIKLSGNDYVSEKNFNKELALGSRRFFDIKKLDEAIERVKKFYQEKGYNDAKITYKIKELKDNQIDISFDVEEGVKNVIREIIFQGNVHVDKGILASEIETRRYNWLISWATGRGILKEEKLEQDVAKLSNYYLNNGYVEVQVAEPVIEHTKDGLRLIYKIQEGSFYNFGEIHAEGDLVQGTEDQTLKEVEAVPSEMFSLKVIRDDANKIAEKYTDVGYAFANVDPRTRVNRENKTVDVVFSIDQGEIVTVDRIVFSGNEKTSDNVIRRMLKIGEGELYSSSKIKRSQELVQRLGFFDEVSITTDPSDKPGSVGLNVGVKEAQTGSFSIGGGISSDDGFIFSVNVTENNVLGSGNSLTADVNTGSRNENYILSFLNPRVNDTRLSLGADLLSVNRIFDDFDRKQVGGAVTLGYPLWFLGEEYLDDINAFVTYELLRIKINNVDENAPQLVKDEEGESTSSSIAPRIVRNTINNPLDPTEGSKQTAKVEIAGLGGDEEFWALRLNNDWYYPLHEFEESGEELTFAQRIDFGYGEAFNDDRFPLFRRLFAGGINSNRGFDARELGPKDEEGNEFGGNKELIANFELIFPLLSQAGVKGLVFYDIGNAFDDDENIMLSELRSAVGFGIRWRSPLAPIRIEFGLPLDKEDGDKSFITHFSFGAPF